MTDPRYPIGPFEQSDCHDLSAAARARRIAQISSLPNEMAAAVRYLSGSDLSLKYRQGGWTVRQVVHHVADSHMHGYLRFKFALALSCPVVAPYDEAAWAELPDSVATPVAASAGIIEGVHARWAALLRAMKPEDFDREYFHPGAGRIFTLNYALATYAWHGAHHVAHVHAAIAANPAMH